MSKANLTF